MRCGHAGLRSGGLPEGKNSGGLALWFRTGDYSDPSRKLSLDGRRSGPGVSVVWRDFDQRRGLEKRSEGQLTTSHQLGKYMGCR